MKSRGDVNLWHGPLGRVFPDWPMALIGDPCYFLPAKHPDSTPSYASIAGDFW